MKKLIVLFLLLIGNLCYAACNYVEVDVNNPQSRTAYYKYAICDYVNNCKKQEYFNYMAKYNFEKEVWSVFPYDVKYEPNWDYMYHLISMFISQEQIVLRDPDIWEEKWGWLNQHKEEYLNLRMKYYRAVHLMHIQEQQEVLTAIMSNYKFIALNKKYQDSKFVDLYLAELLCFYRDTSLQPLKTMSKDVINMTIQHFYTKGVITPQYVESYLKKYSKINE